MGERPIPLHQHEVRGILAGRQSQVRRVLKPQPRAMNEDNETPGYWNKYNYFAPAREWIGHGYHVGQRLWVRETWSHDGPDLETVRARLEDALGGIGCGPYYRATEVAPDTLHWRPSIHMPRWASRLTLTVTDVRVERLQEISEADARAEGVVSPVVGWKAPIVNAQPKSSARYAFRDLWNSINAKRPGFAWDDNPWVVAVTFDAERRNIDAGAG